jgi:hypothetical protein
VMRRLLTGYAVSHNRRHGRTGHLIQIDSVRRGVVLVGTGALRPP